MKALLRLAVSTVVVVANVQAEVIMPNFELDLEHRNIKQLKKIAEKDINVAFGVDAFTEHYRAHMWNIRNNYKHTPWENEIVRYESLKYYNTVYKLILTELARCIFDIKGGMVEYTDDDDEILECKGGKPIEQYDQSNWNYVVFVNVLNRVIHKADYDENKIEDDINEVKDNLKKTYKGAVDVGNIEDAARDIRTYFNVLNLNEYCYTARSARELYNELDEEVEDHKKDYPGWYSEQDVAWELLCNKFGIPRLSYANSHHFHELDIGYETNGNGRCNYAITDDGKNLKNKFKSLRIQLLYGIKGMDVAERDPNPLVEDMIGKERYKNISALMKKKEIKKSIKTQMNKIRQKAEANEEITEDELKLSKINNMIISIRRIPVCGMPDTKDANGNSTEKEEYWAMTKILNEKAKEMYKALDLKFEDEDDEEINSEDIEDAVKSLIGKIKKADKKGKEM